MPINRTPIVENQDDKFKKKKTKIDFILSDPKYDMKDVILSESVTHEINRIISYIKYQNKIFVEWNLGSVIKNHNLSVNLYGESGTGKTMTAHAIAKRLGKKLLIVNYAEIESKYVGETSKNLVGLFDYAKEKDAIILFDEADALLSKRVTAMHSATDVSVNQTRNTLLKILDDYTGIIIFTTNFIKNYDTAFIRRIFSHVRFEMPNKDTRISLWKHYLLDTIPCENRDLVIEQISDIEELTGADISTVVLKATIDAACSSPNLITLQQLKNVVDEILIAKKAVIDNYKITTRKVSEEYALQQINKGGIQNGID